MQRRWQPGDRPRGSGGSQITPTHKVCPEKIAHEITLVELIPEQNQVEVPKANLMGQKHPTNIMVDLQEASIEKRPKVATPPVKDDLAETFVIQPRMKNAPVLDSGSVIKDPAVALSVAPALSLPSDRVTFRAEPNVISIALAAQLAILTERRLVEISCRHYDIVERFDVLKCQLEEEKGKVVALADLSTATTKAEEE
ncbi:hypothetical protein CsSME_00015229 [Camellia sinensis var. sinensis]